jgi:crotonobetainyl-CoA:carnitine CoA-transferase CaiB-like acyl-CoA transferase
VTDYPVEGPLNGLKVIAFEHAWAAPFGSMMLADMGADVVKVEPPGLGDHVRAWTRNDLGGLSPHFLAVNRNKRSIVLDLKTEAGNQVARRLIRASDGLIENFSPTTMARLGLGYDEVTADHPELVYCSVSGFGETGPYSSRRAYDLLIQAEGGLLSVTGTDTQHPAKVGTAVVDILAAMTAAFALVSSLRGAERTGKGRFIDVSMLDVAASSMAFNIFSYGISGVKAQPMGTAHPLLAPYEVFRTASNPVAVAILTEAHWRTFCRLVGRPELVTDERFVDAPMRVANREQLNAELQPVFDRWKSEDLVPALADAGLACAQVNDVGDLIAHPQLRARGFFSEWEVAGRTLIAPGAPWRMMGDHPQGDDRLPAETPGEHAESVLEDWSGFSTDEVQRLGEAGAFGDVS